MIWLGHVGGSVGYVSAFDSVHDLGVLESSPKSSGSLLSGVSATPSPCAPLPCSCSLSLSSSLK